MLWFKKENQHIHTWGQTDKNQMGYFRKGERGKDWYVGIVLKCSGCTAHLFVPDNTEYRAVECTPEGELAAQPK